MADFLTNIANSVKNGFATAQSTYTDWLYEKRPTNNDRPRVQSSDPTQAIDQEQTLNILSFPLDRPKYYITFGFEEYRRPSQFEGLSSNGITDYICLPIPQNLQDNNIFNYSPEQGTFLIEALTKGLRDGGEALTQSMLTGGIDPLKDAAGQLIKNGGDTAMGLGVRGVIAAVQAAEAIAGTSGDKQQGLLAGGMQMGGLADNPFNTISFHGPNFKHHAFSWVLAPKSPEESEMLRKIVYTLKKVAHPELLAMKVGGFFKYPHIVWPKFMPKSLETNLYTFKPCVISEIKINYTPDGAPGFFRTTEAPTRAVIEISLIEIEIWRNGNGEGLGQHMLPRITNGDFNDPTVNDAPTPGNAPVRAGLEQAIRDLGTP